MPKSDKDYEQISIAGDTLTAIRFGNIQQTQLLFNCGANPHWRDTHGNTLLHYVVDEALSSGNQTIFSEMSQLLLNSGLSFSDKNNAGQTPVFALWWTFGDLGDPPIVGFALKSLTKRIPEILDIILARSENLFEKNDLGESFLFRTPVDLRISKYPEYQEMENVLKHYKALEQAQMINQHLNSVGNSNGKKAKI